jgi:hypothetical protein
VPLVNSLTPSTKQPLPKRPTGPRAKEIIECVQATAARSLETTGHYPPFRELRRRSLTTQHDLAFVTNIAVRSIHSWDKGTPPRMAKRRQFLKVFGLDFDRHQEIFGPMPTRTPRVKVPADG